MQAPVAELAYALGLGSSFWEFESPRGYKDVGVQQHPCMQDPKGAGFNGMNRDKDWAV